MLMCLPAVPGAFGSRTGTMPHWEAAFSFFHVRTWFNLGCLQSLRRKTAPSKVSLIKGFRTTGKNLHFQCKLFPVVKNSLLMRLWMTLFFRRDSKHKLKWWFSTLYWRTNFSNFVITAVIYLGVRTRQTSGSHVHSTACFPIILVFLFYIIII